jgi:hypothetical protein
LASLESEQAGSDDLKSFSENAVTEATCRQRAMPTAARKPIGNEQCNSSLFLTVLAHSGESKNALNLTTG